MKDKCKDCINWGMETGGEAGKEARTWGYCKLTETLFGGAVRESLAYAIDTDDTKAYLRTNKDLGCVQWERQTDNLLKS